MSYNIPEKSNLWVLKYRPSILDELSGRDDFINRIREISKEDNVPHMLFTGPEGYGKMTAGILAAKEILDDSMSTNFKIVYAADPLLNAERQMVKKKSYVSTSKVGSMAGKRFTWPAFVFSRIKPFVELKPLGNKAFKLLIIRDFHVLKSEQHGFRRLMEKYSKSCRMILLTSSISSVIDPILSRCSIFFFNRIDQNSFVKLIDGIAAKEELTFNGDISKILYNATSGKIGESINILQKSAFKSKIIGPNEIYKMISNDFQEKLNILTKSVLTGKTENIEKYTRDLFNAGFDFKEIIQGICEEIFHLPLTESVRAGIINVISDADFNAVNLTDERIHLDNLLYRLIAISHAEKEFGVKL